MIYGIKVTSRDSDVTGIFYTTIDINGKQRGKKAYSTQKQNYFFHRSIH